MTAPPHFQEVLQDLTLCRKPYSKEENILITSQKCYHMVPGGSQLLGMCKSVTGNGRKATGVISRLPWSLKEITYSSAKGEVKPLVLGYNLAAHFDKLSHTDQKHLPDSLPNWMLQQTAVVQCKSILGPPCQGQTESCKFTTQAFLRCLLGSCCVSGPLLNTSIERLTNPCSHGSYCLLEITST